MQLPAIKLTEKQIDRLSEISSNIATVVLASVILPAILDKFDPTSILIGSLITLSFWMASIWLRR